MKRFRSPKSGESVGRSNYYVKALSIIKRHHKGESNYVQVALSTLITQANAETIPRNKTKLLSNYRAATDYLKHFGGRLLTIKHGKLLYYTFEKVVVSAQPDIVAEENGELVLIKLNLAKDDFKGGVCAPLLHMLYEAAQASGLPIRSSRVECLQTTSGLRNSGPKMGFPDKRVLDSQCKAILALCSD